MKKIGLTLGGGGARGFAHILFLEALDEMNIRPSVISGTSIGAIIGGFYASGLSGSEIREIAEGIRFRDINKMLDINLFGDALFKGKGVEEFLNRYIKIKTFEELDIPLNIVATDYWKNSQVVVNSGPLIPAIRASMSLPGIFEPLHYKNRILIDGGAVNPLPYDIIRDKCDILIAIDVTGDMEAKNMDKPPNMFESVMGTFQIMQNSILLNKRRITDIDLYVKPEMHGTGILEFHKYKEIMKYADREIDGFKSRLNDLLKGNVLSFFERFKLPGK